MKLSPSVTRSSKRPSANDTGSGKKFKMRSTPVTKSNQGKPSYNFWGETVQQNMLVVGLKGSNPSMRPPYHLHLRDALMDADSSLRATLDFVGCALHCEHWAERPIQDRMGHNIRVYVFHCPPEQAHNVLVLLRNWMAEPENNIYHRLYVVPINWNRTPPTEALKLSEVLTPRDTFDIINHGFGEEMTDGTIALSPDWATTEYDTMVQYVNVERASDRLKELLNIPDTPPQNPPVDPAEEGEIAHDEVVVDEAADTEEEPIVED